MNLLFPLQVKKARSMWSAPEVISMHEERCRVVVWMMSWHTHPSTALPLAGVHFISKWSRSPWDRNQDWNLICVSVFVRGCVFMDVQLRPNEINARLLQEKRSRHKTAPLQEVNYNTSVWEGWAEGADWGMDGGLSNTVAYNMQRRMGGGREREKNRLVALLKLNGS